MATETEELGPRVSNQKRITEPNGWSPFSSYSLGVIARRGLGRSALFETADQIREAATSKPMELLAELPYVHPAVGLALWNALRLICKKDGIKIIAQDKDNQPDKDASKSVEDMWKSQPSEIGGLNGFITQLTIQALMTGLICAEAVPGKPLSGVRRAIPVNSLTIGFHRPRRNDDLQPLQWQLHSDKAPKIAQKNKILDASNWVSLNVNTFFWRGVDCTVDDPYGRAPYANVLSEVLADLALMQDLRDAVHNSAWPRIEIGVDMMMLHKVAVEVYHISNPVAAAKWVNERFQEVVSYAKDLYSDDNIVHHSSGNVRTMQPGSFAGVEPILTFLRHRIVQSLKTLPTLLGINDGTGINYTSVEWSIYTEGLEALRALVCEIVIDISDLHCRLIGSKSKCIAQYEKIRTHDSLVEANKKAIDITNAMNTEKLGYLSHDDASKSVTGKPAYGPAKPGVLDGQVGVDNKPDEGGGVKGQRTKGGPGGGSGRPGGKTQDEQ